MKRILIVVDMQNDFVDGALGTPEAVKIVEPVAQKIRSWKKAACTPPEIPTERIIWKPARENIFLWFTA